VPPHTPEVDEKDDPWVMFLVNDLTHRPTGREIDRPPTPALNPCGL
jgi:hypothetical protein